MSISKIKKFQKFLKKEKIKFFILNRTDEFLSEYIANYAERLNWLTNFSGSAGRAVISQNNVKLFVDGRYTFQAKEEIRSYVKGRLSTNINEIVTSTLTSFSPFSLREAFEFSSAIKSLLTTLPFARRFLLPFISSGNLSSSFLNS